ncbi:MAG: imidazolonepropionase [Spirochaetes bacterium]|nr:imidazolonepropionase [Spirochaetota bacterium]
MKDSIVLTNIGELATPLGRAAQKGADMRRLNIVKDAIIVIDEGIIVYAGPREGKGCREALDKARRREVLVVDAQKRACVPGFIDSHTHFLFAGFRVDEFFWRAEGQSYMEIHNRGGGISRTMEATRKASFEELLELGKNRLDRMLSFGITTVEGKSGYGLDRDTEIRQLEVMAALDSSQPIDIVPTYLGPHAVPPEFTGRASDYIDYVIDQVLPEVASRRLAAFADIFCEEGVFDIDDSQRYLEAAATLGLGLKIHADEIVGIGGAGLAASLKAASADHLLKASRDDLAKMARAGVIAVCLPLTAFTLGEPCADARAMIDSGLALALASDLNPGSCYSQSIPLIFALATLYMKLSFAETLTALTLNGAAALGLAFRTGSLEPGKAGDLIVLDAPEAAHLAYQVGMNLVALTVKNGKIVYRK